MVALFGAEFKQALYSAGYLSAVELLGYLFAAAVFLYGGYRVVEGELTAGTFISFIGTLFLLYNSLQALQRNALNYKALEPVITRIREVLEFIPPERGGDKPFGGLEEKITALNVVYPKDKPILRSVNFEIPKGSKVFVKGASGGGKSTLLKVLSSLYLSYGGSLKYDKTELRDFLLTSFRRKVFYISQRSAIFNDTVRNNLLLAKPNATEGELRRALELAEASFVFDLPEGLDTKLGGGGVELSGGQRQRIALARLFLTRPEVVFL
ncbi:MAG TPA: ABC transporter ATP-binding protein, partial [Aquificales bacterium]|nr:ABC transporter ATP-binding protein [Aquificales bacterium]